MNQIKWHERMQADLVVAGLAERTQTAYLRAVRQLSQYYNGSVPSELTEQQVKDYLLWLRTEKRAAPGTLSLKHACFETFQHDPGHRSALIIKTVRIVTWKRASVRTK